MLIKLLGLEIRTGSDREPEPVQRSRRETQEQPEFNEQPVLSLGGPEVKMNHGEWQKATRGESSSLTLVRHKPHAFTKAIQWPALPDHPMSQTYLSILMNETDRWFREMQRVDICPLRDYVKREGVMLVGRAREAYDILDSLHCVRFNNIHPEVLKNIPALYSSVLSGGEDDFNYEGSGWK